MLTFCCFGFICLFLYVSFILRISRNAFWLYSIPSTPSRCSLLPYPSKFVSSFYFLTHPVQFRLPIYSWVSRHHPLEHAWPTRDPSLFTLIYLFILHPIICPLLPAPLTDILPHFFLPFSFKKWGGSLVPPYPGTSSHCRTRCFSPSEERWDTSVSGVGYTGRQQVQGQPTLQFLGNMHENHICNIWGCG